MSFHFKLPPMPENVLQAVPNRFHIPKHAYRIQHKNSGSLSAFYREGLRPAGSKLKQENLIQAYTEGTPSDVITTTCRRHITWRCKNPPYSPFVSVSDSPVATRDRAKFYLQMAKEHNVQLMTVVKIHTNELIPAIFERKGEQSILMWVSAFVKPVDGQSITEEQFTRLKGQFWVSMSQIHEDLPWGKWWHRTKYNVDEWLVGGAIPRSRVVEILPLIGAEIIEFDDANPRRVVDSVGKNLYQWDWDTKVWSKISEKRERTWCEKESSSGGNDGAEKRKRTWCEKESSSGGNDGAEKRKRTWCEKEWSSGGNDGAYGQQQVYKKMRYNHMWKDTKKMTNMSKRPFDEMEAEEGEAEESEAEESEAETEISQELDGDEDEEGQYEGAAGAMTGDRIE